MGVRSASRITVCERSNSIAAEKFEALADHVVPERFGQIMSRIEKRFGDQRRLVLSGYQFRVHESIGKINLHPAMAKRTVKTKCPG